MASRIFAVLAAISLVGAVAVGTLAPPDILLGEALLAIDRVRVTGVMAWIHGHMPVWLWDGPVTSLLIRPVWLLPAASGLVLGGVAMTMGSLQKAPNSRRRRS